jgi:alpha-tubulin suppressor-like RCC1 family protein
MPTPQNGAPSRAPDRGRLWSAAAAGLLVAGAGCGGDAASPTPPEPVPAVAAAPLAFRQMSTGSTHACGLTTENRAYCWGLNPYGQLGNASFSGGETTTPVAAVSDRRFLEVRVGVDYTCGLTTDNRIYCWGLNTEGQLGDGAGSQYSLGPVPLAGGRRYRLLRTGPGHGCAITLADVTFCWGTNQHGQLGDGTTTNRRAPVKVAGGITFLRVSTGGSHTCGVTSARKAYCWGLNANGQLGNRNSTTRLTPGVVSDGLPFILVSAGTAHTCGVTTDNKAYCWGWNYYGQLGDGTKDRRSRPTAVAGGRTFSGVSPGGTHTCGVTTAKVAYCWGWNYYGQVGDGTDGFSSTRLTPTAVAGGHLFNAVAAAAGYACGVGTDTRGYCWGQNNGGYLGDGTTIHRSTPVPVASPM